MRMLLPLLVLACAPMDEDSSAPSTFLEEGVADPTLPPPTSIDLAAPPTVGVGELYNLNVSGALEGERVIVIQGSEEAPGAGPCPRPLGGYCLDLSKPVAFRGTALADGDGRASVELEAPPYPGAEHCYQAVIVRGAGGLDSALSNVGCTTFCAEGDADGDGVCDGEDECFGVGGDTDGDGTCDDLDPCPIDPADDSDGDGTCDSDDLCPGGDDRLDDDGDGIPNDCDLAIFCSEQAQAWCVANGYPDIDFIGDGNLLCTSTGTSAGSDCNLCGGGWNTVVWQTGPISPYGCGSFSMTAGRVYGGHSPCSCGGPLVECGSWDMAGCIPD